MKKVLLAEDPSIVLKGLLLIFEKEFPGYQLHSVSRMTDLLKALKQQPFSLAVVDISDEPSSSLR